jgi:hypothetical protein
MNRQRLAGCDGEGESNHLRGLEASRHNISVDDQCSSKHACFVANENKLSLFGSGTTEKGRVRLDLHSICYCDKHEDNAWDALYWTASMLNVPSFYYSRQR